MADKTITYRVIIPGFEYDSFGPIVIDEIRISELNGDWLYTTHDGFNSVSKAKDMHFIRFDSNYYPYAAAYTHTVGASQAKPGALGPQYSAVLTDTINYAGGIYKEASAKNYENPEDGINGTFYDFVLDEEVVLGGKHHILSIYPNYKKAIKELKERPRYTEDNNNDEHAGLCYLETLDFYHKFYIKYEAFTNINGKLLKVYEDTVIYSPSGAITAGDITLGSESLAQLYFDQEYIDGEDSWDISDGGSKMDAYRPLLIDPSRKLLYYLPDDHKYSVCTDSNGHELYADSDDLCMHIYPLWQKKDLPHSDRKKNLGARFIYYKDDTSIGVCVSPFRRENYYLGSGTPQVPERGGQIPVHNGIHTPIGNRVGLVRSDTPPEYRYTLWTLLVNFFAKRQSDTLTKFSKWEEGMVSPVESYYSNIVTGLHGQTYNNHGLYRVDTKFFGGQVEDLSENAFSSFSPICSSWWRGKESNAEIEGELGLFEAKRSKDFDNGPRKLWEDWIAKGNLYGCVTESPNEDDTHMIKSWEANGDGLPAIDSGMVTARWPGSKRDEKDNRLFSYGGEGMRLDHFRESYPESEYSGFMYEITRRVASLTAIPCNDRGLYTLSKEYTNTFWYGKPVSYLYYNAPKVTLTNISSISSRFIAGIYEEGENPKNYHVGRSKGKLWVTASDDIKSGNDESVSPITYSNKEGTSAAGFYSGKYFAPDSVMFSTGKSHSLEITEEGFCSIHSKITWTSFLGKSERGSGANSHNQFLYFANNAQLCVELDPATTLYSGISNYSVFKLLFLHKQILDTALGSEQIELLGFQYNPDGNSELLPTNVMTSGDRGIPEAVVEVFGELKFLADVEKHNFHSSIEAPQVAGKLISDRFSLEGDTIYIFHINYLPKTYVDKLTGKRITKGITVTISNTLGSSSSVTLTEGQRYLAIKCPGRTMSNLTMTIMLKGSGPSLVNRILNAGIYTLKPLEGEMEELNYNNLVSALDSEASKTNSDIVMLTQSKGGADVITPWVILPAVFCFSEFGQSCDDKEYNYIGFPEQPYQECVGWYEVDMSQTYGTQKNLYPYAKLTDLESLKNIDLTSYMTAYGEEWWNNTVVTNLLKIRTV